MSLRHDRTARIDRRAFLATAAAAAALTGFAGKAFTQTGAREQGMVTHRIVETNGIKLHVAEQGSGPLVLLCHGWPEAWLSWKHQLPALAAAGYRAVAPDMRGHGESTAPPDVAEYTLLHHVGDMVGLVAALGERSAIIVGHDWGANIAWTGALLRPDLFPAVVAMSVPFRRRSPAPPLATLRKTGQENFYWLYFQTERAEAEFERDPPTTFRRLFAGTGGSLTVPPGHGFLDSFIDPERLPDWLTEEDLAEYVETYRRTGFRGGLNWYRNIDRNWELLAPWQSAAVKQPALFIAGANDGVIHGPMGEAALAQMGETVPGLKRKVLIDGAGHWVQRQRADEVNALLLEFLREVRS
jgi:pimeloyl-ACP methyl ester carboxylesterase